MKVPTSKIALALLAMLGSATVLSAARPTSPTPSAPAMPRAEHRQKGRAAGECSGMDVLVLLRSYFDLAETDDADRIAATAGQLGYRIESLVASVPTPRLSTLGFDGAVAAVTRALESSGYTLDRHDFPWGVASGERAARCQGVPGVLLFRRLPQGDKSESGRLLALFLVTETPTLGIDKKALHESLRQMRTIWQIAESLRDRPGGESSDLPDKVVRLIGPAFSGSAESLALAIRGEPGLRFSILSGTATSAEVKRILMAASSAEHPVTYFATVVPDEIMAAQFYSYLVTHMGVPPHDVAVLTESSTSYGQGLLQDIRKTGHDPATAAEPLGPRLVLPFPLHISRLRSAWELQEQQEMQQQKMAEAAAGKGEFAETGGEGDTGQEIVKTVTQRLTGGAPPDDPDTLSGHGPADQTDHSDILPTLAHKTLQQEDLALDHILSAISSEQIRYVGLLATDSEDKRFLAQQIRRFCPDVVLFTFETDILLAHPDDSANLKGMLVVSTYPINTKNQSWTFPFQGREQRLQFTDRSQGMYNATVVFLHHPEDLLEYAPPFIHDDGRIKQGFRPPVWISAVGQDALVPLAALTDYRDEGHYVFQPEKDGDALHLGKEWQDSLDSLFTERHARKPRRHYSPFRLGATNVVAFLLGLFCIFNCVSYFRLYHHQGEEEGAYPWRWLRVFRGIRSEQDLPGERRWHGLYLLAGFAVQLAFYAYLAGLYFSQFHIDLDAYFRSHPNWYMVGHAWGQDTIFDRTVDTWILGGYVALCVFLLLAAVIDLCCELVRRPAPEAPGGLRGVLRNLFQARHWALLGVAIVLGGTVLTYALLLLLVNVQALSGHAPNIGLILLFQRTAHLEFGLSPAVPLLLLCTALYLWCGYGLKRIWLLREMDHLPAPLCTGLAISGHDRRLRDSLRSVMPGRYYVFTILFALLSLDFFVGRLATLEGRLMTAVFRGLLFFCELGVLLALARLLAVWRHFRGLLFCLGHHPIVDAFDRLPARLAQPLGVQLFQDVPARTREAALLEHWRLLVNHFLRFDHQDPAEQPGELLARRRQEMARFASGPAEGEGVPEDAIPAVLRILDVYWRQRPLEGYLPGGLPPAQDPALSGVGTATLYTRALVDPVHLWLRLAEDFLAICVAWYINRIFPHLRNLLIFITSAVLLLICVVNLYPFQPHRFLTLLVGLLTLSSAGLGLAVFVQMNRDETLSRITRTEPGEITWDRPFVVQVGLYVLVPLLGLSATQFPLLGGAASSALSSLLRILK